MDEDRTYTIFAGQKRIASGPLETVLPEVKKWFDQRRDTLILFFDDQTGKQLDFDLRGTPSEVLARALPPQARTGPGRPKLGVVSREVSLLPRHWDWLEEQPNGASAALRRLVDQVRRQDAEAHRSRLAKDVTLRFMTAMAGDLAGYEEATRALYAGKRPPFNRLIRKWPDDIRTHVERLARDAFKAEEAPVD
jgi:hypothetical protein